MSQAGLWLMGNIFQIRLLFKRKIFISQISAHFIAYDLHFHNAKEIRILAIKK